MGSRERWRVDRVRAPACWSALTLVLAAVACDAGRAEPALSHAPISVSVAPRDPVVQVGHRVSFHATVTGLKAGQSTAVDWTIDEPAGGRIDPDGVFTAPASPGTFRVRATSRAERTATGTSTVSVVAAPPVVTVSVTPQGPIVQAGHRVAFHATVTGLGAGQSTAVDWTIDEAAGGRIDPDGVYTAPASPGTFHVRATSRAAPGASGTSTVSVVAAPPVVTVSVTPQGPVVEVGHRVAFHATVTGLGAGQSTAVDWTIDEAAGGRIDPDGVYTAPASPGTFHVRATSRAEPTATGASTVSVIPAQPIGGPPAAPVVASTRFSPVVTSTSDPMTVSGLGRAVLWWDRTQDRGGWDVRTNLGYVCFNRPVDYVIEGSSDGGTTWSTLLTISGNTYYTRAHVISLTGQNRVRMRLTAPAADLSSQFFFVEVQVHDAAAGLGDWFVFFGDSITANTFAGTTGQVGLGSGRFGELVHQRALGRWPIAHNGGVSQGKFSTFLQVVGGRALFTHWMDDFPGTYVSIGIGTNDINGYSDHAITSAELDLMQGWMEELIGYALAAGKKVVLPTLRWTNTNPYTGVNIAAWNDRLWNTVLPKYPTVIRGPDTYTRALALGSAGLVSDATHLNDAGASLTQEDWVNWAFSTIYTQ